MKRKRGLIPFETLRHAVENEDLETVDLVCSSGCKVEHGMVETKKPRILRKLLRARNTVKHISACSTLVLLMLAGELAAFKELIVHPTARFARPGLVLRHALKHGAAQFIRYLSDFPAAALALPEFTRSRLSPLEVLFLQGHNVPDLRAHPDWHWDHRGFRYLRPRVQDNILLMLACLRRLGLYKDVRLLLVDYYIKSEIP